MRGILIAGMVAVMLATASGADPIPAPKSPAPLPPPLNSGSAGSSGQLRDEVKALSKEREETSKDAGTTAAAAERAVLRAQLAELLKRVNERPVAPPTSRPSLPTRKNFDLPDGTRPLDTIRLAENLFRNEDFDAANRTLRLIDTSLLAREERAFVKYLNACCLRKMNKRDDAAVLYREVAADKDDEFIAECAIWQLSLIRSTQDFEAQLEQLRSRSKSR